MALDMSGMKSLKRSPERRAEETNQLLDMLEKAAAGMSEKDYTFYWNMCELAERGGNFSENQIAWLRDLTSRYL